MDDQQDPDFHQKLDLIQQHMFRYLDHERVHDTKAYFYQAWI